MPSLAIDARMIHASGIGVYLKQIIPFLTPIFKVSVLGNEEELKKMNWGAHVSIIPCYSPIYSIKEQAELFTKIPSCDIFWSPQYNIPLLPVRAKKRVVTIHDTYHLAYQHTLPLAQKVYANVLLNAAVRLSDKVVTVSDFSRQEIMKYTHCPSHKIKVIYNGVNHTLFKADFTENEQETLRINFPNLSENYILYVGNVKPHKNLITLLKAYARLSPTLQKQYGLVIVGKKDGFITPDQEVFQFLQQEPSLEHRVHFTGFVPDDLLPLLYKYASLSVFPSVYEGFGLPPVESMACGCPVLAATAASLPEVCGDAALYFNALDVEELQKQMETVLAEADLRADLVKRGLQQCQKYSWKVSANQLISVFKELLPSV